MNAQHWMVTADDRSGAMETAALLADAGVRTWVQSWDGDAVADPSAACVVIDVRSRHLAPASAAVRMRAAVSGKPEVRGHKMDSTLRGNWVTEIDALRGGRGVLLIAAYPSAGRTCIGGVVRVGGVPIGDSEFAVDAQNPVHTSRPADMLRAAGVAGVLEVTDAAAVGEWAASGAAGVCVADALSDADVGAAVRALGTRRDVLVAGTALAVAALARVGGAGEPPTPRPSLPTGDVLVVCGSRHPTSRAQAQGASSLPGVTVLYPPAELQADPQIVALELAVRAHDAVHERSPSIVVLLGGDTADAFIAERAVRVLGSLAAGVAVGELTLEDRSLTILTKPGGFGQDQLLVDLLSAREAR